MTDTSRRRRTNAPDLLRTFFATNPDEELTIEDVATKFSISVKRAGNILAAMSGNGEIERISVYRLKGSQ